MKLFTKSAIIILTAITGVTLTYPLALGKIGTEEIADLVKKFTVLIDSQSPGSGVIFRKEDQTYSVLTAKHVVESPNDQYFVVTPDGEEYKLSNSQIKKLPHLDLAILQFTSSKNYSSAKLGFSNRIKVGNPVYISGYPHFGAPITSRDFTFVAGIVNRRLVKPLTGGYALIYNNDTEQGMSGGPVVDREGNLVAIHGQSETKTRRIAFGNKATGKLELSTDFKLGIPIGGFSRELAVSRIKPKPPKYPAIEKLKPSLPQTSVTLPASEYTEESEYTEDSGILVAFRAAPRLMDSATTNKCTSAFFAKYYFTISLPEDAEFPLEEVQFKQTSGVNFLGYKIEKTTAFKGTRNDRGKKMFLTLVEENRDDRTISAVLEPPLSPGNTITMAIHPFQTPSIPGVYQLQLKVFPQGPNAQGFPLGFSRIHFYKPC